MSFIEMTENEILNINRIDTQHSRIVELLNKLHDQLGAKFEEESKRLLIELKDTLREHFDTEENLMKEYKYVNFFSHKLEHDRFFSKVKSYITEVDQGKIKLDLEFLKSAKRWFFNHFALNDKKCAEFLLSQGVTQ